jgi:hypothetical protein
MCVVYQCTECGSCAYVYMTTHVCMCACMCTCTCLHVQRPKEDVRGIAHSPSTPLLSHFFEPRAKLVAWPSCPRCLAPQYTCSCAESWGHREMLAHPVLLLTWPFLRILWVVLFCFVKQAAILPASEVSHRQKHTGLGPALCIFSQIVSLFSPACCLRLLLPVWAKKSSLLCPYSTVCLSK